MNAPRLRFEVGTKPSKSGWVKTQLGSLFSFKNGFNASKEQYGSGVKFVNVLDIINNEFIRHDDIIGRVEISDAELRNYDVSYGDILFQRSSETRQEAGQSNVYLGNEPVTFGGFVIRGRPIAEFDPVFMNYALRTPALRNEISKRSGGSTRYNIGQEALSTVPIFLPPLPEQRKIGQFLSAVGEKISVGKSELRVLSAYKRGICQKLFSSDARFRSHSGNQFPNWEIRKLGDVTTWASGGTPPKSEANCWNGTIPWISASAMRGIRYSNSEYKITDRGLAKSTLAEKGTLLILVRGSMLFKKIPIGMAMRDLAFNQDVKSVKTDESVSSEFLLQWLLHSEARILNMVSATGIGAGKLETGHLQNLDIPLPCHEEQTRIVAFLSAIDDRIQATEQRIAASERFRTGLLQQLFVN